jgi:hypothetical protein
LKIIDNGEMRLKKREPFTKTVDILSYQEDGNGGNQSPQDANYFANLAAKQSGHEVELKGRWGKISFPTTSAKFLILHEYSAMRTRRPVQRILADP